MAVNNQIIVRQFSSSITSATISDVWDFFEEAFTGLEGVTFKRDTTNTVMYIYLDDDKKMSVQIKMNDSNNGVLIEYWLGNEKCTYCNLIDSNNTYAAYLRTAYGVAWGTDGYTITLTGFSTLRNVFVTKSTPTLFAGVDTGDTAHYVFSPLHNTIETMQGREYLSDSQGNQRFVVCNAFSCDHNLRLRHLFRILHKDYQSKGRILVGNKRVFYLHKYALEYEEE